MSEDGELIIHTAIKENDDGSVTITVIQPQTVQQKIIFRSLDEWKAFSDAVEAFQGLV